MNEKPRAGAYIGEESAARRRKAVAAATAAAASAHERCFVAVAPSKHRTRRVKSGNAGEGPCGGAAE